MKTRETSNVDDHDSAVGTPVIFVSERNIPSAIYAAMRQVLTRGRQIRTHTTERIPRGNTSILPAWTLPPPSKYSTRTLSPDFPSRVASRSGNTSQRPAGG